MTKVIEAVRQLRGGGAPRGPGPRLRDRPGPRHGRLARHPDGQRHPDPGKGGRMRRRPGRCPAIPPDPGPGRRAVLGGRGRGPAGAAPLPGLRKLHLVPARVLSRLPHVRRGLGRRQRAGHHLQLHREPARQPGAWADQPRTSSPTWSWTRDPRVMTNIVGADPGAVRHWRPVTAVFEPAGDTKVLRFTLF